MDSQVDSETLNNLLENHMMPLSGGESDIDLLGSGPDTNSPEVLQSWMNYWPAHQYTTPLTPLRPPHPPQSTSLSQLIHFGINLPLPHCPLPQHHYHQNILQCITFNDSHIRHPLPQQSPNPDPLTYNPSICHSPSISFQVTPTTSQNLNYLCISPNSAPTFNTTQNHLSSKSSKNTYPNKNTHKKKQKQKQKKPP